MANSGRRHHKLLHGQQLVATPQQPSDISLSGLASAKPALPLKETPLQTALARLPVNGQEITVRVLLRSGSQRSYVSKNIAESLGLQGPSELLRACLRKNRPVISDPRINFPNILGY